MKKMCKLVEKLNTKKEVTDARESKKRNRVTTPSSNTFTFQEYKIEKLKNLNAK